MHGRRQKRIMRQPVAQLLCHPLKPPDLAVLRLDKPSPPGKPASKVLGTRLFDAQFRKPVRHCVQGRGNGLFRPTAQRNRLHLQCCSDAEQQSATDISAIVLDQVEIRGRDVAGPRQCGLSHSFFDAMASYPAACQGVLRHSILCNFKSFLHQLEKNFTISR